MMNSVLILDDHSDRLRSLENELKRYHSQFQTLTAPTIEQSLRIMNASKVSILVSSTNMGAVLLPLLMEVLFRRPPIPCMLMSGRNIESPLEPNPMDGLVTFLGKPYEYNVLGEWVLKWLDRLDEGWNGSGVSGRMFISMIEALGVGCRAEIRSAASENGYLEFNEGELVKARRGEQTGRAALEEISTWENISIVLKEDGERGAPEVELSVRSLPDEPAEAAGGSFNKNEDYLLQVNDDLMEFEEINGFRAVGLFSAEAELLSDHNMGTDHVKGLQVLISNVLAEKIAAMDLMGSGQWGLMHLESTDGHIVVKHVVAQSDDSEESSDHNHFFIVLILEKEGSLASGKMMLERFPLFGEASLLV